MPLQEMDGSSDGIIADNYRKIVVSGDGTTTTYCRCKVRIASTNRILACAKSERGASLPLALLVFLICAALSAVILSAATTSSGRIANLNKTDQRYYAVTSAVELLCEEIKATPKVTIVLKEAKSLSSTGGTSVSKKIIVDGNESPLTSATLPQIVALSWVYGRFANVTGDSSTLPTAGDALNKKTSDSERTVNMNSMTMTPQKGSGSSLDVSGLQAKITGTIEAIDDSQGTLKLNVSNKSTANPSSPDVFTLELKYDLVVQTRTDTDTTSVVTGNDDTQSMTETVTTTTTTTLSLANPQMQVV